MARIQAKQIERILSAWIRINTFTAVGSSNTATTQITSALTSAGKGGVAVPLQVSSSEDTVGVIVTGTYNRVEVYDATSKQKLTDSLGNEVYGRLTQAGGVYTLTYYSLVSGTETAYTFASTSIDFEFVYRFDFHRLPTEALVAIQARNVDEDGDGTGGDVFQEQVTVTAQNTLANLTKTPVTGTTVLLIVNGISYSPAGGSAPFSISGKTITWSVPNSGFNIDTTDHVVAHYSTFE